MSTLYQLEILSPLGIWTPYGPPARSMMAATILGLRLQPDADLRVVAITEPETITVTCRFDTETANSVSQED